MTTWMMPGVPLVLALAMVTLVMGEAAFDPTCYRDQRYDLCRKE